MLIGSHLTITKGLPKAAELAGSIGASSFQFFTRNPRGGKAREIAEKEIADWQVARQSHGIAPIVGHLPYTVNLAASDLRQREFAAMVVKDDLCRVNMIDGEIMVSHPGRHDGDRAAALNRLVELLAPILEENRNELPVFCLETMALQGNEIGSIDDISWILRQLGSGKAGVCLDSAHLFAAGWDLRSPEGCDSLVRELEEKLGLEHIKCLHLNDCKVPLGSHKDRHAKIGRGELGYEGINSIVRHGFLGKLPMILETPVEDYREYQTEIALVKGMLD